MKFGKKKWAVLLCFVSIMLLCLGLAACGTKTYKVTLDYNAEQGEVTLSPEAENNEYEEGTEITVTVKPNNGYELDTLTLSTEDRAATPDNEGKFVFKVQEDTTVSVTFKATTPEPVGDKFSITKNSPENGTIDVSPAADEEGKYAKDTEITVTLKPAQGYEVDTFTVGGVDKKADLQDGVYKFNITADTAIAASFSKIIEKFTLTVPASVDNGTVKVEPASADNKYDEGTEITVTLTPAQGYVVDTFTVGGVDKKAELQDGVYKFKITADTAIEATFKAQQFTVTTSCEAKQGSITLSPDPTEGKYAYGTQVTVTVTAAAGYELDTFTVSTDEGARLDGEGKYTLTVTADTTINATFKMKQVTGIQLSETDIDLESGRADDKGSKTLTYTITPAELQSLVTVTWEVDDDSVASIDQNGKVTAVDSGVTFVMVYVEGTSFSAMCTINVTEHQHTFGYTKSTDGKNHTATCTDCGKVNSEACVLALKPDETAANGHHNECEKCGWTGDSIPHDFTVTKDGSTPVYHRKVCTCGYSEQEAHDATLKVDDEGHWIECSKCEYKQNKVAHTIKYTISEDGQKHTAYCGATNLSCPWKGQEEVHSGSTLAQKSGDLLNHYTECEKCKALYNPTVHSGTQIAKDPDDPDHHYTKCEACEALYNPTAHSGTQIAKDPDDPDHHYTKCEACEALYNPTVHSGTQIAKDPDDPEHHYTKCEACEALYNPTAHSGSTYALQDGDDKNHYTVCEACATLFAPVGHTYSGEYIQKAGDENHHYWKCAVCAYGYSPAEHTLAYEFKDNSVHSVSCKWCKKAFQDEAHDTLDEGKCSKCGYAPITHTLKVDENGYYDGSCTNPDCHENHLFSTDGNGTITEFAANDEVKKIKIPTQIGDEVINSFKGTGTGVFANNAYITDIIVPASVALPSSMAFAGCSNLKSAVILSGYESKGVKSIPTGTFQACENLESIVVPAEITELKALAFGTDTKNVNDFKNSLTIYYLGSTDLTKTEGAAKTYSKANAFLNSAKILKYNESGKVGDEGWHWEIDGVIPKPWKE